MIIKNVLTICLEYIKAISMVRVRWDGLHCIVGSVRQATLNGFG